LKCTEFFADKTGEKGIEFPWPKKYGCSKKGCVVGERLGVCHHEVERMLMGMGNEGGEYGEEWLKKERLRWHPDRFTGRGETQELCKEMFQILQRLIDGA